MRVLQFSGRARRSEVGRPRQSRCYRSDRIPPLDLGLKGVYKGVAFELTGHAQLGHEAGGMWDEWYAMFANGKWGWLAEAQGRFYLTFEQPVSEQSLIPPMDMLELGQPITGLPGSVSLIVGEKGRASMLAAAGEIPYKLTPGEQYYYADLSGPQGEFATLDYSSWPPDLFVGNEVTLQDLGIPETARAREREARRVSAIHLGCPQCGGALDLKAPDQTQRVTCPNCASLLDVGDGKLRFLNALKPGKVLPIIPIHSKGTFEGTEYTVIGFMQRSVKFDKVYYWEEYLLYNPQAGFRWLVRSDDHWNFVKSVPAGQVQQSGRTARFDGRRFKLFQDTAAKVEYVMGEFYWKVSVGEVVRAADLISPPLMLSKEVSLGPGEPQPQQAEAAAGGKQKRQKARKAAAVTETGEVNWSLGTYVDRKEIEKTFGITGLPKPSNVAPNQVFPHKSVYKYWGLLLLAGIVFGIIVMATGSYRKVFESSYALPPVTKPDETQIIFTDQFELKAHQNIRVRATSPVSNSWVYLEGDLISDETGLVQNFSLPVEYYSGVDGGESWSEGDISPDIHMSAMPPGKYTMRLEIQREKWQEPAHVAVVLHQGIPRVLHLFLALLGISIIPVFVVIRHFSFSKRRWQDSDYSPYERVVRRQALQIRVGVRIQEVQSFTVRARYVSNCFDHNCILYPAI